ncbi:unnamed protein product, partial [Brassica rapa]
CTKRKICRPWKFCRWILTGRRGITGRQVRQSEVRNVLIPSNMCGMITGLFPIDWIRERGYPYHVLVNLFR